MKYILSVSVVWLNAAVAVAPAQEMMVSTHPVAGIDPGSQQFPSGRGTNELVVYTPSWPTRTTGTNPYGTEAEVNNGIITAIGGNDREIPRGGIVLSGHGNAARWLQEMNVGDSVSVDSGECRVYATAGSLSKKAESYVKRLSGRRGDRRTTEELGRRAGRSTTAPTSLAEWKRAHRTLDSLYAVAYASGMPSPPSEVRGVWHRPREQSIEGVDSVMRRLASANFNVIFLETFWGGKTVYPSDVADQREEFREFDLLQAYIDAGNRYRIEVHAWVHTFFLGHVNAEKGTIDLNRMLQENPHLKLVHRNGSTLSALEPGYIWACPANPAVQEYVGIIYREIARKYAVAGIQHDYIRFPTSGTVEEHSCFCGYCRAAVKHELGIDLSTIAPEDTIGMRRWSEWKAARITSFVRTMKRQLSSLALSAAVFPDLEGTRRDKMQNWSAWSAERTVSLLSPMSYTSSTDEVAAGLDEMKRKAKGTPIAVGLAPFLGLRADQLLEQIEVSRNNGVQGFVFFEYTTVSDLLLEGLRRGPFRKPAKMISIHEF